jgi:hypothetical protein
MMRAQVEHSEFREAVVRRARGHSVTGLSTTGLSTTGLSTTGLLAAGLAVAGALLAGGCGPDPEGKFDDFVEQTKEDTGGMGSTSGPDTTTEEPTGGGSSTGGPAAYDISGDFLLAVSTTVDRSKPLQFIATNTLTDMGGKMALDTCLQPLTLMQSKVTVPRLPIGDPLCFKGLEVTDGAFTIDAGIVMVTGMANPITGADIVASLVMMGTITNDDLYCDTVTGEVMEPPVGGIDGSSFAAVRLADKTKLPTDVTIDCKGTTVTDK